MVFQNCWCLFQVVFQNSGGFVLLKVGLWFFRRVGSKVYLHWLKTLLMVAGWLACLLACLLVCLLAALLGCSVACLLPCLACLLACWLACLLACLACLPACLAWLLACLLACRLPAGFIVKGWSGKKKNGEGEKKTRKIVRLSLKDGISSDCREEASANGI